MLIVVANVAVEPGVVLRLLATSYHPDFDNTWVVDAATAFAIAAVALVEGVRLINVLSLSLASLVARDPVRSVALDVTHAPDGPLVRVLKASGPARVYLDADGFSLNVANFYPTPDVLAYSHRMSAALGGAHLVVDTSRNGHGRVAGDTVDGGPSFCSPRAGRSARCPPR